MKVGKSLQQLAAEIERQANSKRDFVLPANQVHVEPVAGNDVAIDLGGKHQFAINNVAHGQIAEFTGVPAKYYDRMREQNPALLAVNVNHWLSASPKARLVRVLDERNRAFLSDSFRPLENYDLAQAVLPALLERQATILSCEITERRLYIKAVDNRIERDVPTGKAMGDGGHTIFDTCCPVISIRNSEVGFGLLEIETGVYTRACTNLAFFGGQNMKRRHVGGKQLLDGADKIREFLTDETKRQTDKAIWLQARDVTKAAFDEARFDANIAKLSDLRDDKIEVGAVNKVVELTQRKFSLTESEGHSILTHLIEGGDFTRYGLFNAITRTAEDLPDYDRASDFERLGGQLVELPKSEWRELAIAA